MRNAAAKGLVRPPTGLKMRLPCSVCNVLSMLFFTNQGRGIHYQGLSPAGVSRQAKGIPVINFLDLRPDERVTTMVAAKKWMIAKT